MKKMLFLMLLSCCPFSWVRAQFAGSLAEVYYYAVTSHTANPQVGPATLAFSFNGKQAWLLNESKEVAGELTFVPNPSHPEEYVYERVVTKRGRQSVTAADVVKTVYTYRFSADRLDLKVTSSETSRTTFGKTATQKYELLRAEF